MKTTAKRKAQNVMITDCKHSGMGAISTKAYEDFSSRIKSTLAFDEKACEDAMVMLFNTLYGLDPESGIEDCSEMARIAFRMIRPEIEKAMRRSRMARERARRRKAEKETTAPQKKQLRNTRHVTRKITTAGGNHDKCRHVVDNYEYDQKSGSDRPIFRVE